MTIRPGDYRIGLIEERRRQRLSYPPLGYTLAFDPKSEIPQNEFNIPLLEQLARSTGGAINPRGEEELKTQEIIRSFKPLRSYLVFLALTLFLVEVIFRRFFLPTTFA